MIINEIDLESEINHFTFVHIASKLNSSWKFKVFPFGTKFNSGNSAGEVTRIYIMYQKTVEISTGIIWIHSLGLVHNDEHWKLGHAQKDKVKKKKKDVLFYASF